MHENPCRPERLPSAAERTIGQKNRRTALAVARSVHETDQATQQADQIIAMTNYQQYIRLNAAIRFGKPCITGTRIAVQDILGWLASGMTNEAILDDFPELTIVHIQAALAFAADSKRRTHLLAA